MSLCVCVCGMYQKYSCWLNILPRLIIPILIVSPDWRVGCETYFHVFHPVIFLWLCFYCVHCVSLCLTSFTSRQTVSTVPVADFLIVTVCVCVQEAAVSTVVSFSQEKEGPTEKNPPSPVHSEREALLVGTLMLRLLHLHFLT